MLQTHDWLPEPDSDEERRTVATMIDTALCAEDVSVLTVDQVDALDLSAFEIYSPYEGMTFCTPGVGQQLLHAELRRALDSGGACLALVSAGTVLAVAATNQLDWDSRHFGVPMGKLVVAATRAGRGYLALLVEASLGFARDHLGLVHVAAEACTRDGFLCAALQHTGFERIDTRRYFYAEHLPPRRPKLVSLVEPFRAEHADVVLNIAANTRFPSRFTGDRYLCPTKVRSLYMKWVARAIDDQASRMFVFYRHGVVEGCIFSDVSTLEIGNRSVTMPEAGLGFLTDRGCGGYLPLSYVDVVDAIQQYGHVRTAVSSSNTAACRVLEYLGSRNRVDFHSFRVWLG